MRDKLFSLPIPKANSDPRFKKWMFFDLKTIGIAEVPHLGANEVRRSCQGISEHKHASIMEFSYLVQGEQVWNISGKDYRIHGNELFLVDPGEPHSSGQNPYGKGRLYSFHIRFPKKGKPFLTLDEQEAKPLIDSLRNLPRRCFPGNPSLRLIFDEIILLLLSPDHPLKKLRVARLLQEWLHIVIDCAQAAEPPPKTPDILRVLNCLHGNIGDNPTLLDMAQTARLSLPRFNAKFKKQVGVAPMEYFMRAKVEEGKKLLQNPKLSITEVAFRLGFSSSQYFATVFKRFSNQRPRDFRATGTSLLGK